MIEFNRTYGVEIECILPTGVTRASLARDLTLAGIPCEEQTLNHRVPDKWKTTTDASIGYANTEIVSPPLRGAVGFREIETVCAVLMQRGIRINKACGLHVHIDARRPTPMDLPALKRLALLYVENEAFLDAVQPPSRRGNANHFCSPLANINPSLIAHCQDVDQLLTVLRYNRTRRPREMFGHGHGDIRRYVKLNFVPFLSLGTVEFRQHAGTIDAAKICNWINLAQGMVHTAMTDTSTVAAQVHNVAQTQAIARRVRAGTKNEMVFNMLLRPEGATMKELLAATGWKAINVPRAGAQYGLTVTSRSVRENGRRVLRYHGVAAALTPPTPMPVGATPVAPRAKPTNIAEFIEYVGLSEAERTFFVGRANMFAQPTLNIGIQE